MPFQFFPQIVQKSLGVLSACSRRQYGPNLSLSLFKIKSVTSHRAKFQNWVITRLQHLYINFSNYSEAQQHSEMADNSCLKGPRRGTSD